ncbi:serine/threonine-protein kinase ATR isoform X2 [Halyomorpha halys]|uniref:serine/threonine-protein kinase ATR isoform X2 n=1 Tax=Halyomorpha halys TaxID=286706 RepID=UPI0006D51565|nr:serine/threonine-protein kinase ATR isoform X2 [Halyomorpha halys]
MNVSVEKTKRDEFWVLFDKAFNALYSSDEVEHREKVVGGITSMFTAATQCKDLTHNVCGDFYIWLVQHFVKVLIDNNMRCYHEEIISSFSSLLHCVSIGNWILFNKAFGSLLSIAESIFSTMKSVKSGKSVQLHISEYNLTVPKGIGKWKFNIDVTRYTCWVSVIDCFIKVCNENFEGISRYSKGFHNRIILLLVLLIQICDVEKQFVLLKLLCSVMLQSSPAFTLLEWRKICLSFKVFEQMNFDVLRPEYAELLHSYAKVLNHIIFSQGRNCPKINCLFLESVLEILFLLCHQSDSGLAVWVNIASHLISFAPVKYMRKFDFNRYIKYVPSHKVLYCLFEAYLYKVIEDHVINTGVDTLQRNVLNIREESELWSHFVSSLKKFCQEWANFSLSELKTELEDALQILSMIKRVRTLQDKYQLKFKFFDIITDHDTIISQIYQCISDQSKKELVPSLIQLAVSLVCMMEEKRCFNIKLYKILLCPFIRNMSSCIRAQCFYGMIHLIFIFRKSINFPVSKVIPCIKEAVKKTKDHGDKISLIIYHTLFKTTSNSFLLSTLNLLLKEEVDNVFRNNNLRSVIPCFLSGSCVLTRDFDWTLKCTNCDIVREESQVKFQELNLNKYLDLYGSKYLQLLMSDQTPVSEKRELLIHFNKYMCHIPYLKSSEVLDTLIDALCKLTLDLEFPVGIFKFLLYNQENDLKFEYVKFVVQKVLIFSFKNIRHEGNNWKKTIYTFILDVAQLFKYFILSAIKTFFLFFTFSDIETVYLKEKLVDIAQSHGITMKQLLIIYEVELSQLLVDLIVHNIQTKTCGTEGSITYFSSVFDMRPMQFLEFRCTPHIVSYILLSFEIHQIVPLLNQLSGVLKITLKDLFLKHFAVIFANIYFIEEESLLTRSILILEKYCACDVDTLIYLNYKDLICLIIMNAHKPLKVLRFFHYHIKPDPASMKSGADTLLDHIVGFLTFVDVQLLSSNTSYFIIRSCLRAIPHLIQLLGDVNVTNISFKLLTTLRTGLPRHYHLYPKLCLEAWMYFLYCINPAFLGPHLPTVVSLLTPLFEKFPVDVSSLLYYLIVKKGHLYNEYIPGLYFIQDSNVPKMHEVWLAIQSAIKSNSMIDLIKNTLKHVRNEGVDSRIHYLKFLHEQVRDNRFELLKIIHRADRLTPVIRDIIDCLMINIQYGNSEVKLTCGNCLGVMGAINPARIGYDYNHCSKKKCYVVETEDFAYFVILELTNSLQKSENSYAFNIIASSIQELLKLYFPNKNKERIEEFFKRFPSNERDILKSLLSTRYIFIEPVLIKRDVSKIGSNNCKTTFEWACSWTSELITFIPTDNFCAKVFRICFPSIQLDFQALEALLPHILFQSIQLSKITDLIFIEMEIKYILNSDAPDFYLPSQKNITKGQSKNYGGVSNSNIREGRCVAIILDLIDFLYVARSVLEDGIIDSDYTSNMVRLKSFLHRFSPLSLSLKSYILQDYCRSLFYFERGFSDSSHTDIAPLRYIYAKLNDSDGLFGVIRTSKSIPTVEKSLLSYVVRGNLQDAVSSYEKLSATLNSTECSRALIQAYLCMNKPQIAKDLCYGLLQQNRYVLPTLCNEQAEVLLRNFQFDEVNDLLKMFNDDIKNNWCWGVDLAIMQGDLFSWKAQKMEDKMHCVRQHIVENLSAISNTTLGAYRQGFNHILKLQELDELEKFAGLFKILHQPDVSISDVNNFFDGIDTDLTLDLLPVHGYHTESALNRWQHIILAIQRFVKPLLPELDEIIRNQLGKIYLKAVKIARKSGNLQIANSYMALAEKFATPGLFVENAKLHRAKTETNTAVLILMQGIKEFFPDNNSLTTLELKNRILCAKAKNLIARYNEENVHVDFNEVYENYIDAANTFPSEKNFFYLAQCLYNVHLSETQPDSKSAKRDNQVNAVLYFGQSLNYGCKYIYKSMFCMISLWLDFGMRLHEQKQIMKSGPKDFVNSLESTMDEFNEVMEKNFNMLPKYVFMAVFSQLISRISHPENKGKALLHKMVSNLAIAFPQQAFWMMASFWKMSDADHKKCKEDLIKLIKTEKPDLLTYHANFIELIDVIINICNKKVPAERSFLPLKSISQKIKLIIGKNSIMIPSQKFRTICLPNSKHFEGDVGIFTHKAFPLDLVYFADVENSVQLLNSLQRPKKLTFIGSDGLKYPFMCKPMDDLHLDARMMEFSSVINMYLKRLPPSCDRNLHIRTYSVVPITHECGLIEWLPNLCGYRTILMVTYKKRGYKMSHAEIKTKLDECNSVESKIELFNKELFPAHPPVLDKWFFLQFSSPDSWYVARLAFIRTAAVMSVVGYAVGLGDRHGENILIDTTNGDLVHVDFNCLFNKAQTFSCPEKVPFRLTQNMVKAMGSTGIEGHFVKSCEITTWVMRIHSDQLMCVLKPFLYDPRLQKKTTEREKTKYEIGVVQKKLSGAVITLEKKTKGLSVEGQVRSLVSEATDIRNLCQMFHGWAAYL